MFVDCRNKSLASHELHLQFFAVSFASIEIVYIYNTFGARMWTSLHVCHTFYRENFSSLIESIFDFEKFCIWHRTQRAREREKEWKLFDFEYENPIIYFIYVYVCMHDAHHLQMNLNIQYHYHEWCFFYSYSFNF